MYYIICTVHVHIEQTSLGSCLHAFQMLREHLQDLVRMRVGCCTNALGVSHECVSDAERSCSVPSSNALGFSFEHVWLLVRTRLASHLNMFHTTIECMQSVVRTHSNVERTLLDKKCVILYLLSDGYYIYMLCAKFRSAQSYVGLSCAKFGSKHRATILRLSAQSTDCT